MTHTPTHRPNAGVVEKDANKMKAQMQRLTTAMEFVAVAVRANANGHLPGTKPALDPVLWAIEQLEEAVRAARKAVPQVAPFADYVTPEVPAGHDTILGYLAKNVPHVLELITDPVMDTRRDGFWMGHRMRERRLEVRSVDAPPALVAAGISKVQAYPTSLLRERFG